MRIIIFNNYIKYNAIGNRKYTKNILDRSIYISRKLAPLNNGENFQTASGPRLPNCPMQSSM